MADTYTITGQERTVDVGPNGSISRCVEITFRTKPNDLIGTVRVPETQYNPTDVNRIVGEAADNMEAIHSL